MTYLLLCNRSGDRSNRVRDRVHWGSCRPLCHDVLLILIGCSGMSRTR